MARLAEHDDVREREAAKALALAPSGRASPISAASSTTLYSGLTRLRRPHAGGSPDPLAGREWIVADLHMHTCWSHDCGIEVPELLDHAQAQGLGAIAVTDHNVFGGAQEAADARRAAAT